METASCSSTSASSRKGRTKESASKPRGAEPEEQTADGALKSMFDALTQSDAIQEMERKGVCFKTPEAEERVGAEERANVDRATQQQQQHKSRTLKRSRQPPQGKLWEQAKRAVKNKTATAVAGCDDGDAGGNDPTERCSSASSDAYAHRALFQGAIKHATATQKKIFQ